MFNGGGERKKKLDDFQTETRTFFAFTEKKKGKGNVFPNARTEKERKNGELLMATRLESFQGNLTLKKRGGAKDASRPNSQKENGEYGTATRGGKKKGRKK